MKLGFLGYGNLARALTRGLCRPGGALEPREVTVTARSDATLEVARAAGHVVCRTAAELFATCNTVVLAVKPYVFRELASELRGLITPTHRVISVMCAVHIDEIQTALGCPVLRVMPTLAAADACDLLGYSDAAQFADVVPLLRTLGDALPLDEDMLDRLTVAASCGLGFAAHILEAYKRECMVLGFDDEQSDAIVRRMFAYAAGVGQAETADGNADEDRFSALERRVATRGGATEAGNLAMDAELRRALAAAFAAAGDRAVPKK